MNTPPQITTVTGALVAGRPLLDGCTLDAAAAGQTIAVTGGDTTKPVVAYLYGPGRTDPKLCRLTTLALPTPLPPGTYYLKAQRQGDGDAAYLTLRFDVAATAAKPPLPPVAHDNKPAEVGVPVPVQGTPIVNPWPNGFGACFNFRDGPAWVKRGLSIGVTHFRSFAETINAGGGFPRDGFAAAKTILDACPTANLIGLHGPAEPCPSPSPTVDDFARFFTALRPKLVGYEGRYAVELFNEFNANHYLSVSKDSRVVSADVIKYVVAVAAAARKALGPDVMVIGPSIGYLVDPAPQLAWTQALHDAGLQQYVNVWNTHVYPDTLTNLVTTLAGVRAIIGPTMPLAFTEISWSRLAKADWPTRAPMYRKAVQAVNAMPCAYRLLPAGNDLDDRALFHADGTPDPVIQAAWGVGVTA